jgi:prolyl oligopeptidase
VRVSDPYRWLEDAKSPDVVAWVAAQDAYARRELARLPNRDALAARLKELSYVESVGTPRRAGGKLFYPRRDAGKEKYTIYVRARPGEPERVLLDPNAWSTDGSRSLGVWSISNDGGRVAYTVKGNNSDEATLYVMDVASGKKSDVDVIEGAKYAWPSWTPSGDGFFYTWLPPADGVSAADRPGYAEVRFHALGTDPAHDPTVRERTGDAKTFLSAGVDRSGRWLIASVEHGWSRTDVYVRDRHGKPEWVPLVVGTDARYEVSVDRGHFFVLTNEGAPNYRVFRVDPSRMRRDQWVEIVPERPDATLEGLTVVGHALSLAYLKDVTGRLEVRDENGKLVREVALPGLGSVSVLSGEEDDDVAYYSFQSFTSPTEIFETKVSTGATKSWYTLHVPVDPAAYVAEQSFATSADGTRVPFFVLHARNGGNTGDAPAMLYGYGGFQVAQTPVFAPSIFPWLEQGGIWVVANLRGGSEYGEAWHRKGMRREKQHVFDDYFAVAEELVRSKFTRPGKIAALGASNGGLLVGAAITQRPDLFGAALCGVP